VTNVLVAAYIQCGYIGRDKIRSATYLSAAVHEHAFHGRETAQENKGKSKARILVIFMKKSTQLLDLHVCPFS
jgi:hypothetical protein